MCDVMLSGERGGGAPVVDPPFGSAVVVIAGFHI